MYINEKYPLEEAEKYLMYFHAYTRVLKKCPKGDNQQDEQVRKRYYSSIALLGVKMFCHYPPIKSKEDAINCFNGISALKGIIGFLTLREFMNIFPIRKDFKSQKYGFKDYFHTIQAIQELGLEMDEPIGDKVLEFLVEYVNDDIDEFIAQSMIAMNAIRQHEGHLHLWEEFLASIGEETENTFRNSKNEAFYVHKGKPVKIQRASRLKVVK